MHVCILRHICFEGKLVLSLTRSNFFTGGNHVNSVPDLAARPPPPPTPLPPLAQAHRNEAERKMQELSNTLCRYLICNRVGKCFQD